MWHFISVTAQHYRNSLIPRFTFIIQQNEIQICLCKGFNLALNTAYFITSLQDVQKQPLALIIMDSVVSQSGPKCIPACLVQEVPWHTHCVLLVAKPTSSMKVFTNSYNIGQGSSTFQIVRATLTISMMPVGHKAIHDVHEHIIGKSGRSVNLTTNRYIMCRQRAGLVFVVILSKRPAGHALKTPDIG
jgi:hypothetical protein